MTKTELINILTQKIAEGQTLATLYITAFTVYMTISGALLKFTFDALKEDRKEIQSALSSIGAVISIIYVLACILMYIVSHFLSNDIYALNKQLEEPLVSPQMLFLKFTTIVTGVFTSFAIYGWIFVIRKMVNDKNKSRSQIISLK